jgi:tousled-like kinase
MDQTFGINDMSICTVMQYCEGEDLDSYMKSNNITTWPEKEARSIIAQVVSGLRYLNDRPNKIIHYDLKPANVIFHKG